MQTCLTFSHLQITAFEKNFSRSQPRLKIFKRDHSRDEKLFRAKTPEIFSRSRRKTAKIPEKFFKDQMRSRSRLKNFTCDPDRVEFFSNAITSSL